jgi:hypothetical protein
MRLSTFDPGCQKNNGSACDHQTHPCLNLFENKPQINADERRFVNLNIQHLSEVYPENGLIISPQSTQRSQSFAIPATKYETAPPSRRGTRMTRIARIFTDLCASVSTVAPVDVAHTYGSRHTWRSVFYRNPSAFICVYLRLIFVSLNDRIQEIQFDLFPIINEKINNELERTLYELTQPEFVSVRISSLFSRYLFSCSVINQSIWRNL